MDNHSIIQKRKKLNVRRHDGSLCTQKQPETAAFRVIKAATSSYTPMNRIKVHVVH